jgi:NAD(P)H dehydrogenase (quinone)
MGKILVLYQSNTGNTAKMATLTAEGAGRVPDTEVRLRSVKEASAEDLKWCDGIALGAPTNFGTVPWKMKKWWDDLIDKNVWPYIDGKIGCAFSSAGSIGGGQELTCMALNIILMNFGILVFGLTDYTGPGLSAHYGVGQLGQPRTDGEIEACNRLGQRLAEWVSVYIDHNPDSHPLKQTYKRLPDAY